jgi:hypothetical protein
LFSGRRTLRREVFFFNLILPTMLKLLTLN